MTDPNETVSTERLTLRPLADTDASAIFDIYSRPEVAQWIGDGSAMSSPVAARDKIARLQDRGGGRTGLGAFGVVDRADGPVVGLALLVPLPSSAAMVRSDVEIGWHLHPEVWGRGYATEAATALIERAWALGLEEVFAVTKPENLASQAVCRRLRMRDLGLRDDWYDRQTRAFVLRRASSRVD